jgi:hypothetical protein
MQPRLEEVAMVRKLVWISIVAVAVVAIAAPASARGTRYRGETSAGGPIGFRLFRSDDTLFLKGFMYQAELECEDGSSFEIWSQWVFGGGFPLEGRRLAFHDGFGAEVIHIEGRFKARTAEGTFRNVQAWLTEDEQAQLCTTGELTWTADRTGSVSTPRIAPQGEPDRVVRRGAVTVRTWITG